MITTDLVAFAGRLVATGLGLVLVLWLLRRLVRLLPLAPSRRATLQRVTPAAEVLIVTLAAAWLLTTALTDWPAIRLAAPLAVLALLAGAAWFAIRDVVSGAILRAEQPLGIGQRIQSGGVAGRVRAVGLRSLDVELENGGSVRLPYSHIARSSLTRLPGSEASTAHSFTIALPPSLTPADAAARARAAALVCFYASAAHEPHVDLIIEGDAPAALRITVYALDRLFLPDVERAVRHAVHD